MKEIEVKQKRYKCENCGATYSDLSHFYKCLISGKEVCDKCGKKVEIYKLDWQSNCIIYIHPDYYKIGYDFWENEYVDIIQYLEAEMYKKIDEINKKYLQNDEEYLRSWLPKIDEWKRNQEEEE